MSGNEVVLRILAYDRPGALDRISGLIRRKGWNIDSLTAGDMGGGLTQICISMHGPTVDAKALGEHLSELDSVHSWEECGRDTHIMQEMVMFCVEKNEECMSNINGAHVIARRGGTIYAVYTGTPDEVDELLGSMRGRMLSSVRSGPLLIGDGEEGEAHGASI